MKKILITRRLLRSCEDKAKEIFNPILNLNDELFSQKKFPLNYVGIVKVMGYFY